MRRIREIVEDIKVRYPNDDFFSDFKDGCRINPNKRKAFFAYNRALMALDNDSYQILREKAVRHYLDHREGQLKQGFFNQLNEAFAYRYLSGKGFGNVRMIKEGKRRTPDIGYTTQGKERYCEVKTLNISEDEIKRRRTVACYDGSIYQHLGAGFLNKFNDAVKRAWEQIEPFGRIGLVYVMIAFDDFCLDYYENYRKELKEYCKEKGFNNLYIKIDYRGNKRIDISSLQGM